MESEQEASRVRIHSLAPFSESGCLLVLEEIEGSRLLPIFTGPNEAQALAIEFSGITPTRPLTHDLLVAAIEAMGGQVLRVVVTEVRGSTFYARIDVQMHGHVIPIDARPSDAINVAVRSGCPILVANQVFEKAQTIMKPIAAEDVTRFKAELESVDVNRAFLDLEGKPAPRER